MNARNYVNVAAEGVTADNIVWLLVTTTAALVAGAVSGWISARFRQREAKQERIRPDWAASYNCTMPSTLFLFAEHFAWIRLLQERLASNSSNLTRQKIDFSPRSGA